MLTLSFVMKFRPATNMCRPLVGGVARLPIPPPPPLKRGGEKPLPLGGERLHLLAMLQLDQTRFHAYSCLAAISGGILHQPDGCR